MNTTLPLETANIANSIEQPMVTIVVVPRERFSYSQQSLESVYAETDYPFELVYVDGGSSPQLKAYLETQSREKQFKLIRTEHFLSPNRARNIGIQAARGKYIVFVDNDGSFFAGKFYGCDFVFKRTIINGFLSAAIKNSSRSRLTGSSAVVLV